eukprot:1683789-Prymnesium_polylepis.1
MPVIDLYKDPCNLPSATMGRVTLAAAGQHKVTIGASRTERMFAAHQSGSCNCDRYVRWRRHQVPATLRLGPTPAELVDVDVPIKPRC